MSAALKLELFQNGALLREIPVEGQIIWLGRGEDCGIRLDDRAISRRHAALTPVGHGIEFEKKSKFGEVRMDGREVEYATLVGGECLVLGPYELRVVRRQAVAYPPEIESAAPELIPLEAELPLEPVLAEPPVAAGDIPLAEVPAEGGPESPAVFMDDFSAEPAASAEAEPLLAPSSEGIPLEEDPGGSEFSGVEEDGKTRMFSAAAVSMKPIFEFNHADGVRAYDIVDEEIAIGRSQNCHVVLDDKRSSRKHAILLRKDGKFLLRDLGSSNGTLVNGERVDERELVSGDEIQIGDIRFIFKMVQADYEARKENFFQVPEEPVPPPPPVPEYAAPMEPLSPMYGMGGAMANPLDSAAIPQNPPLPDFGPAGEEDSSLITKARNWFRAMPVKKQIIYAAVIFMGVWVLLDDEAPEKKAVLQMGAPQKAAAKKEQKKPPGPATPTFESLTPEQKSYVESQYKIAFEYYRNREYDSALLELEKIFAIVQNYSSAREIEAFAREGKRKLAAMEEERKRRETERQTQIRLQSLIDQAGLLMDAKKYKEAEGVFPEIELIQPENAAVANWRKQIIEESERMEREAKEAERVALLKRQLWGEFAEAEKLMEAKDYFGALDRLDALLARDGVDRKLADAVKKTIHAAETAIADARDPLLEKGRELEKSENFSEAFKAYAKASEIDPTNEDAPAGMDRIQGVLTSKAKAVYSEGVIAESFSDFEVAEKKYREVMEMVPPEHAYFGKASKRIRRILSARQPASGGAPQ